MLRPARLYELARHCRDRRHQPLPRAKQSRRSIRPRRPNC